MIPYGYIHTCGFAATEQLRHSYMSEAMALLDLSLNPIGPDAICDFAAAFCDSALRHLVTTLLQA